MDEQLSEVDENEESSVYGDMDTGRNGDCRVVSKGDGAGQVVSGQW